MPNTTNFNWPTPADTDLVKDGAAAIRNLGNGVDTSLVDLKGGTTGQILSKASNADMDFTFVTPNVGDLTEVQAGVGISVASGTGPIPIITNSSTDLITTAGDLLYGTAADTVARLGIGTAGQILKVNSGATAPEWGTVASGSTFVGAYATKTAAQTLTNNTDTILTWNAERFDTDGFHDNSTNNSRMTIPAGKGGKYLVIACAYWVTGSGYRELNVYKNNSLANYFYTVIDANYGFQNVSTIVDCVATDYLEVRGFQNSGGNLNVNAGAENSFFCVTYLGA
jgi:hypothetical protein